MFGHGKLERRLRAERPRPNDDFLQSLTARIDGERTPVRRPAVRLGLALAVAVVSLVAAGVTGGLSYAAGAVGHASGSLANTFRGSGSSSSSAASVNSGLISAASTQYTASGYYCFKTTHGNSYKEIFVSNQSDFDLQTGKGYEALRYDAGQNMQSTCNNGHFH
jgi:hypothetical protein